MNLYNEIIVDGDTCTLILSDDLKLAGIIKEDFWYSASGLVLGSFPEPVLNIPLILNIAPAIWAAGLTVSVPVMDARLHESLSVLRNVFRGMYPRLVWSGELSAQALVQPEGAISAGRTAILFSGGLDSVFSTIRHLQEAPALLTIRGSDIPLNDHVGWAAVQRQTWEFAGRYRLEYFFIESNFFIFQDREFLNHLLPGNPGWFTGVQHGMGFAGLMAPFIAARKIPNAYIAASHSQSFSMPWGSLPQVDNQIAYLNTRFTHDGHEYTRQGKIRFVVDQVRKSELTLPLLRVCYSKIWLHRDRTEYNAGENCCVCEKCTRTISALLVEGADPRQFGFDVSIPEFIANTHLAYSRHKFRFGGNEIFMWEDIQKSIRPEPEYRDMGLAPEILEYIEWLRKCAFKDYAAQFEKRVARKKRLVGLIKMVPGLYGALRALKKTMQGRG